MDAPTLRRKIIELCQTRGTGKTVCPSEVARAMDDDGWRSLMPNVRECAASLVDQGILVATQRGELIDVATVKGPIRLAHKIDLRPDSTRTIDLINLGEACSDDLARVDIENLGDLRRLGAIRTFEAIMVDKLHRGVKKNLFHAMYLYALWGALHDRNCIRLPISIREGLKRQAVDLKADLLGN